MAAVSAAMFRPGALDPSCYATQRIYDTTENTRGKKWSSRLKLNTSGNAKPSERSPESPYLYGTISAPGGSALSKSMKYAETWLYGSVRAQTPPVRPSVFTAYPDVPGPVLISTPQKPTPHNYALILCSCPEYLNGTKKSSSTKVSICKKCKGSRLPLTIAESPRMIVGGTVRGPQINRDAGILRAGTVRVQSSKSRPSILKSQNGDNSDPYDLMRRSRLAQPQDTRIGSQFSTSRSRAKSISPCRVRTRRPSPPSDTLRKNRSKSVSRFNELWVEDPSTAIVETKKSILSCDVNPYDLVQKSIKHPKSLVEFEFDDHYAEFLNDTANTVRQLNNNTSNNNNFKAISGQKIRIAEEYKAEDLSLYDPIDFKYDLKNSDLKNQEHLEARSLPNSKRESKKPSNRNSNKKLILNVPTSNRTKQKAASPKRPPRRVRNRTDDDSESDTQKISERVSNRRITYDVKTAKYKSPNADNIKSILKKPKNYDNVEVKNLEKCEINPENKRNSSQFYLPKPRTENSYTNSQSTILQRKRVQFLVENDETKVIYTAEFNLSENTVRGIPGDVNLESEDDVVAEGDIVSESLSKDTIKNTDLNYQDIQNDSGVYEDVEIKNDREKLHKDTNEVNILNADLDMEKSILTYESTAANSEDNEVPKITILRRSESERVSTSGTISPPRFLDTMALRPKSRHGQIHTSQVFVFNNHESGTILGDKIQIDIADRENDGIASLRDSFDYHNDKGNLSDSSDITKEILNDLRKNVLISPEPPPRTKSKERKSKKNNYVKTRFIRSNSSSSTSDEWSDANDYEKKTILKVQQFENEHDNSKSKSNESFYSDIDTRRTSIQINGNECYSTMNMSNNDVPIYLSSVVVNDDHNIPSNHYQAGATVTISVGTPEKEIKRSKSQIYIGAELSEECKKNDANTYEEFCNKENSLKERKPMNTNSNEDLLSILNDPVEAVKRNLIPHVCGKKDKLDENPGRSKLNQELDQEKNKDVENKIADKSGFVSKIFDDPFFGHLAEGLDSDLVKKLIENSLIKLQETKIQEESPDRENGNSLEHLIETSLKNLKKEYSSNATKNNTEESKQITGDNKQIEENDKPNTKNKSVTQENEENGCSAPYESMEYESGAMGVFSDLEPMSDCYNASASELSTEDDTNSTRSKFYQMLVDAALCEIEIANNTDDDHHYESIRLNSDPIYEEIGDTPPPLPVNPPPSSLSLLDDEKRSGSRSIFEGASKYDILSYLVDAKERGIDDEETYITTYVTDSDASRIEESKNKLLAKEILNNRLCNNTRQISNASDSSEDNSLVICQENMEKTAVSKKTSAEIERNDSGVGSETSKSSRSRLQGKTSSNDSTIDKDSPIHLCEDCDTTVEAQINDRGSIYAPLVCRKCAKKRSERKEILTEIVETEEKYGRDLQIILEEFYNPMLVAGLLTQEQLSAIFLNVEELIENNQVLSEKLRDALEIAIEQGDEDLLTVNVGKILLECSGMLTAFQTYCVRQAGAALLLAGLEKEKELLRIFLRVSQMENTVLRRMNLNSFLMVPVQRVTKYPLLLSRLYRATAGCAAEREDVKNAQRCVERRLEEMNAAAAAAAAAARDVPLWRRLAAAKRTAHDLHVADIRLRKMAVDVLDWNHDDARFAMEGKLLFTQPNDNNWRKGRTIKLTPINALLVTNGKPTSVHKGSEAREVREAREAREGEALFARSGVREAALLLVREKAGRYTLQRDPLYLDRCVVAADHEPEHFFEVHEITTKDSYIFKSEESCRTRTWYRQLQYHAQGSGAWRKRRNALANIMINPMLTRN